LGGNLYLEKHYIWASFSV